MLAFLISHNQPTTAQAPNIAHQKLAILQLTTVAVTTARVASEDIYLRV